MTAKEAGERFDAEQGPCVSTEIAKDSLRSKLGWLDLIPEDELNKCDNKKIVAACRACYCVLAPLATYYVDGEEM